MKTLIVTGASRGIGHEICTLAAIKGYQVIALSRNIKPLLGIENIYPFAVDLSHETAIQDFIKTISKSFSKVDALINSAGSLINKPFLETSCEEFKKVYQVNIFAVASLIRLIFPMMTPQGHVVNISSMGGVQGTTKFPGLSAYSSSKACLLYTSDAADE